MDVLVLCAEELQPPSAAYPGVHVIHAPMLDSYDVPVETATRAARRAVEHHRKGKRILVCCHMGLNRSGLVVGIMLNLLGMRSSEAVYLIKRQRSGALFNPAFKHYLTYGP